MNDLMKIIVSTYINILYIIQACIQGGLGDQPPLEMFKV